MVLEDKLKEAIEEEEQAYLDYMEMAYDAKQLGMHDVSGMLKDIADDEERHAELIRRMHKSMVSEREKPEEIKLGGMYVCAYCGEEIKEGIAHYCPGADAEREARGEIELSGEMIEVPIGRSFPETYSRWVEIGMDIKEKAGIDDYATTAQVNEHLYHICKEEEDPVQAQEAKRALTRLAGKFGVR